MNKKVLLRLSRHQSARVGGALLLLVFFMAAFAPFLAPEGYNEQDLIMRLEGPSLEAPLGTDHLGRQLTSRIIWGGRITLQIAFMATLYWTGHRHSSRSYSWILWRLH